MRRLVALAAALGALAPAPAAAASPLPLTPCRGHLCGTLSVLEDRAQPDGRTIGIHVEVIPAAQPSRRAPEPLALLAGGPGGAASELDELATSIFYDTWQTHDILLVDQRGTGESNPLFCPAGMITVDSPATWVTNYWNACISFYGVDPRLYTTSVAMQDLDEVRAALGYERLNLYGGSYGATAAQYYLLQFPNRVRAVIFDGGTTLDIPIFERWAQNGQRALDRLFARCAKDKACKKAFPHPAADLRLVLARLTKQPALVKGVKVTAEAFANAVQVASRNPQSAAEIPFGLRRAASRGVAALVGTGAVAPPEPIRQLMYWASVCTEPWARADDKRAAALDAGSYLASTMAGARAYGAAVCAAMPPFTDVTGADRQVASNVPALWLVGSDDPQDPLSNIAGVTSTMPNAKVVVVRAAGHGAVHIGCAPSIANTFLARGTAAGLSTACAAKTPYPAWRLR